MKQILYSFLFLFAVTGFAQTTETPQIEPIEADRPDQTETPAIVPKGMFQMENGFVFEKDGGNKSFIAPTALWKYGVNENFELRLITELSFSEIEGEKRDGLNPVKVGFKAKLLDEKGIVPKTSIIAHLQIPDLASKILKAENYATLFRFTMQHTLTDKISLGYNLGAEWDGNVSDATFIYTLTGGYKITEDLGCYVEVFGFAPEEDKASHNADGGFTYLLSDNFMLDASAGFGLTQNAPDYYVSAGFSFRL